MCVCVCVKTHSFDSGEEGLKPSSGDLTVAVQKHQHLATSKFRPSHPCPHQSVPLLHSHQMHLWYGSQQLPVFSWVWVRERGRGERERGEGGERERIECASQVTWETYNYR